MQLGNPQTIQALLASIGQPVRASRHRAQPVVITKTVRLHKAPGCPRGCTCRTCSDNARWERIFQEKFADPRLLLNPHNQEWFQLVRLLISRPRNSAAGIVVVLAAKKIYA